MKLEQTKNTELLLENELIKDRLRQLENKQRELKFEQLRKYEIQLEKEESSRTRFEELGELQFKIEESTRTRFEQLEKRLEESRNQQRYMVYVVIALIAFIVSRMI